MHFQKVKIYTLSVFALFYSISSLAQQTKDPFKINLSENGTSYIKFGMNFQVWGRYTELNSGSKIGNNVTSNTYDIVLRRLRLQAFGMLTEKVFMHLQLGQNNINNLQNSGQSNTALSILDALGEYHFSDKLHIGAGLTGWGAGTTRYSAQSSSTQLTLDNPLYQQNINTSAIFGNRNLSIYAKGIFNKLNYRIAVTKPFQNNTNNLNFNSTVSTEIPRMQYSGIFTYNFFEKETNTTPYSKATYLGTKRILNIGLGYLYQNKAMWHQDATTPSITKHDNLNVLGFDLFYDNPISSKGDAITLYVAYNNCNYGKNYIRSIAIPNPAINDSSLINGSGNGFIGVGTGNIFYSQAGYLFAKSENSKTKGKTQIYAAGQIADLETLETPMSLYELGVNYYLTGIVSPKITLGYQNRAVFEKVLSGKNPQIDRKSMLALQFQASF